MTLLITENMPCDDLGPHRIVAAAIFQDGQVYSSPPPARHHDLIRMMAETMKLPTPIQGEQGFILETGTFVRRKPALHIARETGQIIEKNGNANMLFSEDLW